MATGAQQLKLLLWKDVLLRRRKPITIGGIIWASVALLSLVIVRKNVEPEPKPTCVFTARALPSAGVVPFLQSFLCTLGNDCDTLDKYQELPDYKSTRLQQYLQQFVPIFEDKQIMRMLHTLPGAGRLLATITRSIDVPELHQIVNRGLKVYDLFKNKNEAIKILSKHLKISNNISETFLESSLNIENILRVLSSNIRLTCNVDIFSQFFNSTNSHHIKLLFQEICRLNAKESDNLIRKLVPEIDIGRYINMVGKIIKNMSGSESIINLFNMMEAFLKLLSLENYVPEELQLNKWASVIKNGSTEVEFRGFSYVNVNMLYRILNLFEPIFRDSASFQNIHTMMDVMSATFQKFKTLLDNQQSGDDSNVGESIQKFFSHNATSYKSLNSQKSSQKFIQGLDLFVSTMKSVFKEGSIEGSANGISQILQVVLDNLPNELRHQVTFVLTISNKFVLGSINSAKVHLHMQTIMYETLKANPKTMEVIGKLGPDTISKLMDGLSDANRIQAIKGKIFHPGQLFCDVNRLQVLLNMNKKDALNVKGIICTTQWKTFASEVVKNFGVNNASNTINNIASMVVSETLRPNGEIETIKVKDFITNFLNLASYIKNEILDSKETTLDWDALFVNVTNYKDIKNVFLRPNYSSNLVLVTVHTALAHEVISGNGLLETYMTPLIVKFSKVLKAFNSQLDKVPEDLMKELSNNWSKLYEIILEILKDKDKGLSLIIDKNLYFCNTTNSLNVGNYSDDEKDSLVLICKINKAIQDKLNSNPEDDKLIQAMKWLISNSSSESKNMNWVELIKDMQHLYKKVYKNFGFLFANHENKLTDLLNQLENELDDSPLFRSPTTMLQISFSIFTRSMDILSSRIFDMDKVSVWKELKTKYYYLSMFIKEMNIYTETLTAFLNRDSNYTMKELPIISGHLRTLALNFAPLVRDVASFIATKQIDIDPILDALVKSPKWPCGDSGLGLALKFSEPSITALNSIEVLMCSGKEISDEWNSVDFFIWLDGWKSNNTLENLPSENMFYDTVFYFNNLIKNLNLLGDAISNMNMDQFNLVGAFEDAVNIFSAEDNTVIARRFFKNLDLILNITNEGSTENGPQSANQLWESFFVCSHDAKNVSGLDCRPIAWKAVRFTAKYMAEAGTQIVRDLTEYFSEVLDTNTDFLQIMGFTKKTGLHILFEKMPDFIDILFNSFLDLNFMKQISRAAGRRFWDCERVVDSLVLPTNKHIDENHIKLIKPYLCPSLVHWVSIPTDENVLFDLFAKSQNLYFNKPASDFDAKFEDFFDGVLNLKSVMKTFPKNNTNYEIFPGIDNWIAKFKNIGKTLIIHSNKTVTRKDILHSNYVIDGLNSLYLIRISYIIDFMYSKLGAINNDTQLPLNKSETKDYETFLKILNRKPEDTARLFVYAISENLKTIEDYQKFDIAQSLDTVCQANESIWTPENMWMKGNFRIMKQFCKCDYNKYISLLRTNSTQDDFLPNKVIKEFIGIIQNLNEVYNRDVLNKLDWKDTFALFLKLNTESAGEQIKNSVSYFRELGLQSMITFEHSKLNYWNLSLTLLNGEDWWSVLKRVTNESILIDIIENSADIVDDLISNMSKIKIIRLIKDIDVDKIELLCKANMTDYVPDKTQLISRLKDYLCGINQTELYYRIPPLRLASQIYDDDYITDEKINETVLFEDMKAMENNLILLMKNGPQTTKLPDWLSDDDLMYYSSLEAKLNQVPNKVEIAFLVINNMMDASTIFYNASYSPVSSAMTPWIKQINLQLIKSSEYSAFVCDIPNLTENEIYNDLIDNFHWDLALQEVISGRNYTMIELNKALFELSDIAKHYAHSSIMGSMDKVMGCLINSTDDHPISKASMYITLGSRVVRLIRVMMPQLRNIRGFSENVVLTQLRSSLKTTLPIPVPVMKLIKNETLFKHKIWEHFPAVNKSSINVLFKMNLNINMDLSKLDNILSSTVISIIKQNSNGSINMKQEKALKQIMLDNVNHKYISDNMESLYLTEFWSFKWIQDISKGVEGVLWHSGQMLKSLGNFEWDEVSKGVPNAILDVVIYLMKEQFLDNLAYRVDSIIDELHPLFANFDIEKDLRKISSGLKTITVFRKEIIATVPLKFNISEMFQDWDELQEKIINKTSLPLLLVQEIQNGSFNLGPLINPDYDVSHVEDYVCGPTLSKLLQFESTEITLADVSKHLCRLTNSQIRNLASELLQKLNMTYISDKVMKVIIKEVMNSSDLTEEEGMTVLSVIRETASLIPTFQSKFSSLSTTIKEEPLLKSFQTSNNLMDALANTNFLSNAGNLLCGKPFRTNVNRFYKAIGEITDFNQHQSEDQIDSMQSDFCRDLQKEITQNTAGKVLWSYAKPLIMGKILYTPESPQIKKIILQANTSFSQVGELTSLLHKLSDAFVSLEEIVEHKSSLEDIYLIIKSPYIREGLTKLGGKNLDDDQISLNLPDVNLIDILSQFGDVSKMRNMLKKLTQLTDCISLNRFTPVENEEDLETKAAELMKTNRFLAGLVFLNPTKKNQSIEYKIRMDIDNVPSTSRTKNQFWSPGPDADFIDNLRYFRGFVQLQDIIDKAIIQTWSNHTVVKRDLKSGGSLTMRYNDTPLKDWSIHTQQMPYPCWVKDDFQTTMYESQALIVAFFFCLILTVSSVVRFIVWERESGNTALMCVMGMKRNWHTFSWLSVSFVEVTLTMFAICIILKWGTILPNTNILLLMMILINFGISIVMFCYMISSTFKSASLGAVSAAILYLLTFMPFIIIIAMEAELKLSQKSLASLFMSSGFSYSLLQIARFEVQGTGLQWYNFWHSPKADDDMSVGLSCFIIIFDSCLYALIGFLINLIKYRDNVDVGFIGNVIDRKQSKHKVGVRIDKLNKTYNRGNVKALTDVSIDLCKGHITTLLGHNGAGKTTLINILTGIIKPTSGEIIINTNLENKETGNKFRNTVGLCPQFDVLLESLSAREHLTYYAQLKTGRTALEVLEEVNEMLSALGLGSLSEEPVKCLSGGLRRRLCVGLAFIAYPYLVVLDEPSSGVDPVARRDIWTLILGLKAERTILLTTHHLDEAEVLSDNVFIMHKGKIQASGAPSELKEKYGEGFKLSLSYPLSQQPFITHSNLWEKKSNGGVDMVSNQTANSVVEADQRLKQLLDVVNTVTSNVKVKDVKSYSIEINVPYLNNEGVKDNMVSVTKALEEKQPELNYSSLAVDCSGLEEVFLSLCEENTNEKTNEPDKNNVINFNDSDNNVNWNSEAKVCKSLWHLQLMALLYKRFLHYMRNPRLLIAALVLPTLFVAVAMGFSLIRPPPDSLNPLDLHSNLYGDYSVEFASLDKNANVHSTQLNSVVRGIIDTSSRNRSIQSWVETNQECQCVNGWQSCSKNTEIDNDSLPNEKTILLPSTKNVVQWIVDTHDEFIEKRYGGWSSIYLENIANTSLQRNNFVVWYNNKGQHAMPSYLNTLNNAILKYKTGNNHSRISTFSHPLKLSPEQLSKATLLQHVADVGISVVLLIGFSLVPAVSAVFLVEERCTQQKRLQLLSAVHPVTYWLASLLWDVMMMCAAIVLSVIVFKIFALPVYVSKSNLSAICFLLFIYGVSSSTLVHLLEKIFREPSLANMVIFCCNVFFSVIGLTILLIIDVVTTSDMAQHIRHVLHDIFLLWPGFSLGDGLVSISRNSIQADVLTRFGLDTYLPPLSWDVVGPHCLVLSLTALVFFTINVLIELRAFDGIFDIFYKKSTSTKDCKEEDCDVATERYRVELATNNIHCNMGYRDDNETTVDQNSEKAYGVMKIEPKWKKECDVLQVLGLHKEYPGITGSRVAVQNISFGVKKGQCFGLLGINGAGKSTTFSMLTGELKPTSGHIYLNGKRASQRDLCNGSVAYCPQNDALDPLLTLKEHLEFYCRIRGIENSKQKITSIIEDLELLRYKERRAGTLSGGNKRKLCLAIALLGDAKVLLLDEPTSGMDPKARLHAGSVLIKATQRGRALLLSSHSLLECEALCSPTGLMWNGKFLALGAPSYLKQRFAGGHVVSLVGNGSKLWKLSQAEWKNIQLLSLHPSSVQILIGKQELSSIFRGIASLCTQTELRDYSINQSSLEQVFINFCNAQDPPHPTKQPSGVRVSTLESQYSLQPSSSVKACDTLQKHPEPESKDTMTFDTKF